MHSNRQMRSKRHALALNFLRNIPLDGPQLSPVYTLFNVQTFNSQVQKPGSSNARDQPTTSHITKDLSVDDSQQAKLDSLNSFSICECPSSTEKQELQCSRQTKIGNHMKFSAIETGNPNRVCTVAEVHDSMEEESETYSHRDAPTLIIENQSNHVANHISQSLDEGDVFGAEAISYKFRRSLSVKKDRSKSSAQEGEVIPMKLMDIKRHELKPKQVVQVAERSRRNSSRSSESTGSELPVSDALSSSNRVIVTCQKMPIGVFSVVTAMRSIKRSRPEHDRRKTRVSLHIALESDVRCITPLVKNSLVLDQSYSCYLQPQYSGTQLSASTQVPQALQPDQISLYSVNQEDGRTDATEPAYDPHMLDDPDLGSGRHRTTLNFLSYKSSVLDYVKPSDLKKHLNEQFHERFPAVQLTLSKLRSIKRDLKRALLTVTKDESHLWTLAQAYVYFEKLVLKGLINKENRKYVAAVCLLLSAKLNDIKKPQCVQLVREMESTLHLSAKELLHYELPVITALRFALHIPDAEISPQLQRIVYTTDQSAFT